MQTCPYLAMPSRAVQLHVDKLQKRTDKKLEDISMYPKRPEVFVAVGATSQHIKQSATIPGHYLVRPAKPYIGIEYWKDGVRLSNEEGLNIAKQAVTVSLAST